MLRIRIHEIQAIAKMETMDKHVTMAQGVQNAILSPFKFVLDVLRNPAEAVLGIPKGLWRYATRIHEMLNRKRGELEEDESKELLGFSMVKRELADSLGVDVYSSNRTLQRKLNRLSWAGYAGDTGVRLLTIPISGPAGLVLTGTSWSNTLGQVFRDHSPEDLRRMNRETLEEMEISEAIIDEFLQHPWYSPRHETLLVKALSELTEVKKRETFIQVALSAEFEEEAFFFQRLATMMAAYHHNVEPLDEIVTIDNRLVMGHTKEHTLVVMHSSARLSWDSEIGESDGSTVQTWKSKEHLVDNIVVWTSGNVTSRAAKHFAAKGLTVHEQAMDKIMLAKNPKPQETPIPVIASLPVPQAPPDEDITW